MPKYNYEQLNQLYHKEGLPVAEVAERMKVSPRAIRNAMARLNIPRRTVSEANKLAVVKGKGHYWGSREDNPYWKGGRRVDQHGYIYILTKSKDASGPAKYEREHRLVWEQVHNKPLPKGWEVHHLNGIRSDNRPENLIAMPKKKHDRFPEELREKMAQKIRELEAGNRQLRRALEDSQLIFEISEN